MEMHELATAGADVSLWDLQYYSSKVSLAKTRATVVQDEQCLSSNCEGGPV